MASRSVAISVSNFTQTTGTRIARRTRRPLDMTTEQPRLIYRLPTDDPLRPERCDGITRDKRVGRDISYPGGEAFDFNVAGVVVRHDMDETGRVTNARLLGAIPAGPFGESAMRAVQTWQYKMPTNVSPACLKNKDISVSFVIG